METSPFGYSFRHTMRSLASPNNTGGYLSSVSSYYDHPPLARAAIDDYGPLKAKAQSASVAHESNSKAVLTALRGLKEKIRKLELERDKADKNLKSLAVETSEYKDMLQREHSMTEEKNTQIEFQNRELELQLKDAESRCKLLEEQLNRMHEVAQAAHTLTPSSTTARVHFSSEPKAGPAYVIRDQSPLQIEKLAELERDHMKLTLSHTLAENKIRDLEEKIKEEKHQRKLLQDKAAELQTMAESNRILLTLNSPEEGKASKPLIKRKKKVKNTGKQATKNSLSRSPVQDHYHLDLKNIPFVVGKSTGESHSLGANVQNVISLMKSHNPNLCKTISKKTRQYKPSSGESSSESGGSLTELLSTLQDEFGHMGFEHSELIRTIQDTEDDKERAALEKELHTLVSRMETKGEQISLLKKHQQKHKPEKTRNSRKSKESKPAKEMQHHRSVSLKGSEVEVVTTIKTKSKTPTSPKLRTNRTNQSLETFRKVKKLQTSLQKDDLSWD